MKTIIKTYILVICSMILCSCGGVPLAKGPAQNNTTYNIEYLFEHDGCKVYRFRDDGHYVYFTNCNNTTTNFKSDSTVVRVISTNNKIE